MKSAVTTVVVVTSKKLARDLCERFVQLGLRFQFLKTKSGWEFEVSS